VSAAVLREIANRSLYLENSKKFLFKQTFCKYIVCGGLVLGKNGGAEYPIKDKKGIHPP